MTTQPVPAPNDPRHLLAMKRALVDQVRREQRGAWFPLLVFAAVRFGAAPVVRYGQGDHVRLAFWYYPMALVLAYVAITWFYLRRSNRLGLGTRVGPYVALGIALALPISANEMWRSMGSGFYPDFQEPTPLSLFFDHVLSPAGTIGLALLLLARIERSWPLLGITCAYLAVMLSPSDLPRTSAWGFPGILFEGGVLLLGGVGLALLQRVQGRSAA